MTAPVPMPEKQVMLPVFLFLLIGGALAYIDSQLNLSTVLLECIHAVVVTLIFLVCVYYGQRYPQIRHVGWSSIVWGMAFLMLGTWMDILDDPPRVCALGHVSFPFGPSWERAFLKKTLGYTIGIGLFAYGFFQWIPWMIRTRLDIQKLNQRLSSTNRNLNQALMSLDEHVESERVGISRELHDDVAQQLTFVNVQLQLCRKELESGDPQRLENARLKLGEIGANVSDALKSVRQISGDLRPEPVFSLGLIPALEQFMEKLQQQYPETEISFKFIPLEAGASQTQIEKSATDTQRLHLFRVTQEGARNALKHARASRLAVSIREEVVTSADSQSDAVLLRVAIADNGRGLPWREIPGDDVLIQQGHLGIVGLKERVKALCGEFSLSNCTDGPGALLEITLQS